MPNELTYYASFGAFYKDLLRNIAASTSRVWVETYSLDDSAEATGVLRALARAALRGVQCVICADAVGSFRSLPREKLNIFRELGGKFCIWHPLFHPNKLLYRNHRKLVVCDDRVYCLSGNLDARSLQADAARKRDINHALSFTGPAARAGVASVHRTLRSCEVPFARKLTAKTAAPVGGGAAAFRPAPSAHRFCHVRAKWLEGGAFDMLHEHSYKAALRACLSRASDSVLLASAYFQPPRFLRRAIVGALRRRVNVQLFLSGQSDIPGDCQATDYVVRRYFNGASIFRTHQRHLHLKTLIVDKAAVVFGSYNWDRLSARRNREAGLLIEDARVARCMAAEIARTGAEPCEIRPPVFRQRVMQWCCYQALRLGSRSPRRKATD